MGPDAWGGHFLAILHLTDPSARSLWNLNLFQDAVVSDAIDERAGHRIDDSGDTIVTADKTTKLLPGYRIRPPQIETPNTMLLDR